MSNRQFRYRVRPARGMSAAGLVVGCIFVGIGLFVITPMAGPVGLIWSALAVVGTIFHGINAFTDKGIATEEIQIDSSELPSEGNEITDSDVESRLRTLDDLLAKKLITAEEHGRKRADILDNL